MTDKPWRAKHNGIGYAAEFLRPGERTWRFVRSKGSIAIFATVREALDAAQTAYLRRVEPEIRATLPVDPTRLKAKLEAEAENWLKAKPKTAETIYPGKGRRPILTMKGTA